MTAKEAAELLWECNGHNYIRAYKALYNTFPPEWVEKPPFGARMPELVFFKQVLDLRKHLAEEDELLGFKRSAFTPEGAIIQIIHQKCRQAWLDR